MLFSLFLERLPIFFAVPADSHHSGDNVASQPVAHRLHGDNQFPAVFQYKTAHYRRGDRWVHGRYI